MSYPSPCLDVCKFKRRGHCIACGMNKVQKRSYEGLRDPAAQEAFIATLMEQQVEVGSSRTWPADFARKCERHGVVPPGIVTGE